MRTTVRFDSDVAAAVDRLRRAEHLGLNAAVNTLIRRGLSRPSAARSDHRRRSRDMGMRVDVANVQEALDVAEGFHRR